MLNPINLLSTNERQIVYNFAYTTNYNISGTDLKEFIKAHGEAIFKYDFKTACRVELFLNEILENTTERHMKNKISKFLERTPNNVFPVDMRKFS